jgi:hypothetical protein
MWKLRGAAEYTSILLETSLRRRYFYRAEQVAVERRVMGPYVAIVKEKVFRR